VEERQQQRQQLRQLEQHQHTNTAADNHLRSLLLLRNVFDVDEVDDGIDNVAAVEARVVAVLTAAATPVVVVVDVRNNSSTGDVYVSFGSSTDAQRALEALGAHIPPHSIMVGDRNVSVSVVVDNEAEFAAAKRTQAPPPPTTTTTTAAAAAAAPSCTQFIPSQQQPLPPLTLLPPLSGTVATGMRSSLSADDVARLLLLVRGTPPFSTDAAARAALTDALCSRQPHVVVAIAGALELFAARSAALGDFSDTGGARDISELTDTLLRIAVAYSGGCSSSGSTTVGQSSAPSATTLAIATPLVDVSPSGQSSQLINAIGVLPLDWAQVLQEEVGGGGGYYEAIGRYVYAERQTYNVYPSATDVFAALRLTPLASVKAVIIGQDPYFRPNQAHGLSFSVRRGVKVPPSLSRIYAELERSTTFTRPSHGNLVEWAQRGVLLLNATLTVREGQPNSHAKCGWQRFTDAIIRELNERKQNVVYLLWGQFAWKKGSIVRTDRNLVIRTAHPSPMATGGSFVGCNCFVDANKYLEQHGRGAIDWRLSP